MYPVEMVLPNKKTKKKDGTLKKIKTKKDRNEKSNLYITKSFFPFPDLLMFYQSLLEAPDWIEFLFLE